MSGMTPERLAEIRERVVDRVAGLYVESDRRELLAEVERLQAENKRAMECFDRDQKVIADLQAAVDRLRAQVAAVEKSIAEQTRYALGELRHATGSFEDRLTGWMAALGEIRAALASDTEVQP